MFVKIKKKRTRKQSNLLLYMVNVKKGIISRVGFRVHHFIPSIIAPRLFESMYHEPHFLHEEFSLKSSVFVLEDRVNSF